jgi:hypothetical protein
VRPHAIAPPFFSFFLSLFVFFNFTPFPFSFSSFFSLPCIFSPSSFPFTPRHHFLRTQFYSGIIHLHLYIVFVTSFFIFIIYTPPILSLSLFPTRSLIQIQPSALSIPLSFIHCLRHTDLNTNIGGADKQNIRPDQKIRAHTHIHTPPHPF